MIFLLTTYYIQMTYPSNDLLFLMSQMCPFFKHFIILLLFIYIYIYMYIYFYNESSLLYTLHTTTISHVAQNKPLLLNSAGFICCLFSCLACSECGRGRYVNIHSPVTTYAAGHRIVTDQQFSHCP